MEKRLILSFRVLLSAGLVVATLLALFVAQMYLSKQLSSEIYTEGLNKQRFITKNIAQALKQQITEKSREISQFSHYVLPNMHMGNAEKMTREIDALQEKFEYYSWLGFANINGDVIASSKQVLQGNNVGHRPWFSSGLKDSFVGNVHSALMLNKFLKPNKRGEPQRLLDFSSPVLNQHGDVVGVFGAHVSFDWMSEQIETLISQYKGERFEIFLVGNNDMVHYPESLIDRMIEQSLVSINKSNGVIDWSDGSYLTLSEPVFDGIAPPLDWVVVTRTPEASLFAQIDVFNDILYLTFAIILGVILVFAYLLLRLVATPLDHLVDMAKHVAHDFNELPATVINISEFESLEQALRVANREIVQQQQALQKANLNLDEQVKVRTRELQASLDELNAMQSLSSRIYASVAHELRAPVAAINKATNQDNDWLQAKLMVRLITEQLLTVIDDVRIAINPGLELEVRDVEINLKDMLDSINILVSPLINERSIKYEGVLGDKALANPGGWVLDVFRLRIVVSNLIKNACIHSKGTHVRLEMELVDGMLDVRVSDNGVGIDEHAVERLYLPYERGDTEAKGSGMGLYIAKNWLERVGGRIRYRFLKPGSQFVVTLPMRQSSEVEDVSSLSEYAYQSPLVEKTALLRKTVLIVDDDGVSRLLCKALLMDYFETVIECSAPNEVFNFIRDVDVLISDYHMPEMDGDVLIAKLRVQGYKGYIVALTASLDEQEHAMLLEAGANSVLVKPISRKSVMQLADSFAHKHVQSARIT